MVHLAFFATKYNVSLTLVFDFSDFLQQNDNGSWFRVWHNDSMSCAEKVAFARASASVFPPSGSGAFSVADFMSPHYWYLVVADCASTSGLDFDYVVEWCVLLP